MLFPRLFVLPSASGPLVVSKTSGTVFPDTDLQTGE